MEKIYIVSMEIGLHGYNTMKAFSTFAKAKEFVAGYIRERYGNIRISADEYDTFAMYTIFSGMDFVTFKVKETTID